MRVAAQAWRICPHSPMNCAVRSYVEPRRNDKHSPLGFLWRRNRQAQQKRRCAEPAISRLALHHGFLIGREPNGYPIILGRLSCLFLHGAACTHNRTGNQSLTLVLFVRTIGTMKNEAIALVIDPERQQKGVEIAASARLVKKGASWLVPSQSLPTKYTVVLNDDGGFCTCPDHAATGRACKHQIAVQIVVKRETNAEGEETVTARLPRHIRAAIVEARTTPPRSKRRSCS